MCGAKLRQFIAAFGSSISCLGVGISFSFSSFAIPQLMLGEGGITLSEDEASWFASSYAIGSLSGSLLAAVVCDKLGRKMSLIIDAITFFIGFLIMALCPNFWVLMIGRYLTGHACGATFVGAPIFISEISHATMRGITGNIFMILYTCGFTLSMLLGALLSWRNVLFVCLAYPISSVAVLLFMHESPSWLFKHKTEEKAISSLRFYRDSEDVVREDLERIKENIRHQEKLEELEGASTYIGKIKVISSKLMSRRFLKPFLFLNLILCIGFEFSGFPALAFYMHTILVRAETPLDSYWEAVLVATYRMVVTIGASFLFVKFPRRKVYLYSGMIVALALAIQGTYEVVCDYLPMYIHNKTTWIPLAGILLQYTGSGLGYLPIIFILQGEILPSDLRGLGSGLLGVMDNIFLFGAVKTVPLFMHSFGIGGTSFFYCCVCIFTLVISYFVMPETQNMSLEDIEDAFRGHPQNKTSKGASA